MMRGIPGANFKVLLSALAEGCLKGLMDTHPPSELSQRASGKAATSSSEPCCLPGTVQRIALASGNFGYEQGSQLWALSQSCTGSQGPVNPSQPQTTWPQRGVAEWRVGPAQALSRPISHQSFLPVSASRGACSIKVPSCSPGMLCPEDIHPSKLICSQVLLLPLIMEKLRLHCAEGLGIEGSTCCG